MGRAKGKAKRRNLSYVQLTRFAPPTIRLVPSKGDARAKRDPMCDYVEGAVWWLARSDRSPRELQKAFDQQEVATVLYERTGAIIDMGGREGKQYRIAIQLVRLDNGKDWDIDLCLAEIGVYIDEVYEELE